MPGNWKSDAKGRKKNSYPHGFKLVQKQKSTDKERYKGSLRWAQGVQESI